MPINTFPLQDEFDMLDSGFQEKLSLIADRRPGLTALSVFQLWREYSDRYFGQSCILHEFHRIYADQIGDEYGFRTTDLVCDFQGHVGVILERHGDSSYAISIGGQRALRYANQITLIRSPIKIYTFVTDDDNGHNISVLTNESDMVDAIISKAIEHHEKYAALRSTQYGSDEWDNLTEQWRESAGSSLNWYYWDEHLVTLNPAQ